jgi:2-dehydropantoate 2-reductase
MVTGSRVLIIGVGAMGCLFAARLAAAGFEVAMLGNWPAALDAIRTYGVRLVELDGEERAFPVELISDLGCQPVKYALVLVKSWQTSRAARQLSPCLVSDGLAVTLQNGLGNREALMSVLGQPRVAQGVTTLAARLLEPGRVQVAGEGKITLEFNPALKTFSGLLRRAGFEVDEVQDVGALLWGKLVINAAINPLTALLGSPNGELLVREPAHTLMVAAAQETAAVAAANGIHLPYHDPVAAVEDVARRTAVNRSSMLQDIDRSAPTEIDSICGAVVQTGERLGLETPLNRAFWLLIKSLPTG